MFGLAFVVPDAIPLLAPTLLIAPSVIWLFVLVKRYETALPNAMGIAISVNVVFYIALNLLGPIIIRMFRG